MPFPFQNHSFPLKITTIVNNKMHITIKELDELWSKFITRDSLLCTYLEELVDAAKNRILSALQVYLFIQKIEGKTYKDIRETLDISNDSGVAKLIEKTALGIRWDKTGNYGRYSVLSTIDQEIFKKYI